MPKNLIMAVEYLQKLLGVTELNLDDMEPETRKIVQEASCWLADNIEIPEKED